MDALTLPHCAHGTATCIAERQNVREQPNTTSQILGKLSKGQTVTVWAFDDGWMIVQDESGLTGWAVAEYLLLANGDLVA